MTQRLTSTPNRRGILLLLLLTSFGLPSRPVAAQPPAGECAIPPGSGATLLFPYFEVDTANPSGQTTLISINNSSFDPTLARVVLWTNWGNPVLAFDLFLDDFDIVTINLRDVLNGILPSTGASADLSGFPFCASSPPHHANPILTASQIGQLGALLKGQADPILGDCWGENYGDGRARGYITVDAARECSGTQTVGGVFSAPNNVAYPYFGDGSSTGIATYRNVLWGDIVNIDPTNNFADGSEAIALWASPSSLAGPNVFTFYGRFHGWDGRDHRVPLPSGFNLRFLNGGPFAGGASNIVYHDPGVPNVGSAVCGTRPDPVLPLGGFVSAVDEDGNNPVSLSTLPLDLVSQKVSVSLLGIPYAAGYLQIRQPDSQLWVQPVLSARTRFSLSFNAAPYTFLCGLHPLPL